MSHSSEAHINAMNKDEDARQAALAVVQPTAIIPNAQNLRLLATDMFNSKMFRGVENPAQAVAIIQMGAELGFGPVTSLNIIKIIQGQMTVAARGLLALAQNKAGVSWQVVESDDKRCAMKFSRPKWDDMEISFTLEDAKAAGLLRAGGGWEKYPKDMLFARCASRGVRRIAPDAISGLYATEEIQDAAPFQPIETAVVVEQEELGGQGDRPSGSSGVGVPDSAETRPAPAPPSHTPKWDGHVVLTLSTGEQAKCSYFDAAKYYGAVKKALGSQYYELLGSIGYEHYDDLPKDQVAVIFDALVKLAKGKKA